MNSFLKGVRRSGNVSTHRSPAMKALTLVAHQPPSDTPATGMPAIRSVKPESSEEVRQTTPLPPAPGQTIAPVSAPPPESSRFRHTAPLWHIAVPIPAQTASTASLQVTEGAREMAQQGVNAVFRALSWATDQNIIYQMERRDRVVFLLLDGKRSIQDIAHLINRNELDIARTLVRLLKSCYIEPVATLQ